MLNSIYIYIQLIYLVINLLKIYNRYKYRAEKNININFI